LTPALPFRVFGPAARPAALPPLERPLGIGCSFRVPGPPKYRAHWLRDPASPLAVSSALRSSLGRLRRRQLSHQRALSSSFAFLQSLAQRFLARQPQPASSSHGLSLPSAHEGLAVHSTRVLPRPATFRLQGLATLLAASSRRAPASFVSHRQRSWDSPFGAFPSRKVSGAFPPGNTHMPFLPPVFPPREAMGRPNGPRLLGFNPSESPWRPNGV
jgi:hypothetical protein